MKLFQSLLFSVLFVSAIIFTGCNENQTTSVAPDNNTPGLSKLTLPAGALISSATFNIYVEDVSGEDITVHKVNVPWDESETWNSFFAKTPPQFEAASLGGFNATGGLKTVDITALVQAWVDGTTPNNGVLLNQPEIGELISTYRSSEYIGANQPFLSVTYTVNGGAPVNVQEPALMDTYISTLYPDGGDTEYGNNGTYGDDEYLRVGRISTTYLKYALVQFDIEQPTTELVCGTGYAYGGNLATCFIGLPGVNSNNWGWSNFISAGASTDYDWPIYVGAGQCDLTKGTLVGYLHVNYNHLTDELTLDYTLDAGYTNSSLKIWIGSTYLPFKNGKYSTAPGQFNHKEPAVPYTVTGLSNNFYIAAHFDICWQD